MRFEFDPAKSAKNVRSADCILNLPRDCFGYRGSNGRTGGVCMAKQDSARSVKSKPASSSLRSRAAGTRSSSFRSAKPTTGKRKNIVSISGAEAAMKPVDWDRIDATSEAEIRRHARQDGTGLPPDREWRRMIRGGQVRLVLPEQVDVRAIRTKLKLSQTEFAEHFGFTPSAVRQWEQGRRYPHGPARVLLTIIDREPEAVRRALSNPKSW